MKYKGKSNSAILQLSHILAQSGGATEYTDCKRGKTPLTSVLDKQSDGEALVMLKLWGMWNTLLLLLLPGTLWPGVVAPDRVLSMGQLELNCVLMLNRTVYMYKNVFGIK